MFDAATTQTSRSYKYSHEQSTNLNVGWRRRLAMRANALIHQGGTEEGQKESFTLVKAFHFSTAISFISFIFWTIGLSELAAAVVLLCHPPLILLAELYSIIIQILSWIHIPSSWLVLPPQSLVLTAQPCAAAAFKRVRLMVVPLVRWKLVV